MYEIKQNKEILNDFNEILQKTLNLDYLKFNNFRDLLNFLFDYSKKQKLIIIFDEFQNFFNIDKWIFSDFQYFWDLNKNTSKIKLFCLWSHFTLMKEIFENNKNPLFWRKTASFYLKSFDIITQINILNDYNILSEKNLVYFFSIFYWIPKYIDIFIKNWWFNLNKNIHLNQKQNINLNQNFLDILLNNFIKENSFFFFEWKELFALEFWKSYDIYFSILTAISIWKTKKNEISDFTGINDNSLGVYLKKLEVYFELIERNIPITDKKNSKNSKYKVKDLFLKFWFRYIYKYSYLLEINDYEWLKNFIINDIDVFLWINFEELAKKIILIENLNNKLPFRIEKIWSFFDKKWQNEIDIICVNSKEKKVLFLECKINSKNINTKQLDIIKDKVKKSWIYYNYKQYFWFATLENINLENINLKNIKIECDYFLSLEDFIKNNNHI